LVSELFFHPFDHIHQFGNGTIVTIPHRILDTVMGVILEQAQGYGIQRRTQSSYLREDIDAITILLNHIGNATHLSFYPSQSAE
jgi:hypothetical protein